MSLAVRMVAFNSASHAAYSGGMRVVMLRRLWFAASHLVWNCPPGCCTVAESIDPARLPRSASRHGTKREERLCRTPRRSTDEDTDRRSGRIGARSDSKPLTSVAVPRMITSFIILFMMRSRGRWACQFVKPIFHQTLFGQPLCVSLNVNHGNCSAELQ